jgi:hypothetical protein
LGSLEITCSAVNSIWRALDESLLRLSRQRKNSAVLVLGHLSAGRNLRYAVRFSLSRLHLEEVLALDQAGIHPQTNSQSLLGIVLFCLGFRWQGATQQSLWLGDWPSSDFSYELVERRRGAFARQRQRSPA